MSEVNVTSPTTKGSEVERIVMRDIDMLKETFDELGIEYTVREKQSDDEVYHYLFIGECRSIYNPHMTFLTGDLEKLLISHKFIEFENGKLATYFNA